VHVYPPPPLSKKIPNTEDNKKMYATEVRFGIFIHSSKLPNKGESEASKAFVLHLSSKFGWNPYATNFQKTIKKCFGLFTVFNIYGRIPRT